MKQQELYSQLKDIGVVPVVVLEDSRQAVPVARALAAGGILTAEVTFRTPAAAESIRRMRAELPQLLVGAGTVLTPETAASAQKAGAQYVVSPGLNPRVVEWCQSHELPVIPGVATPTEVEAALALGLDHLKFFPAGVCGGTAMLKALAGPYAGVQFMATGGIGPKELPDYLACPNLFAVGGGWLTGGKKIVEEDWAGITAACTQAVNCVQACRAAVR